MTIVIGLTGQTGAGKTTVSDALRTRGIPVVDADLLARDVVNNSKSCLGDLVLEFGCDIIDHNGELSRKRLSSVVFTDKKKLRRLNAITHPHIVQSIEEHILHYKAAAVPLLVLDAPTLYEAGADKLCNAVIAVLAPEDQRLRRIMQRDSLSEAEAMMRIRSQHDDDFYRSRAHYVLENTGAKSEMLAYMDTILAALLPGQETSYEAAKH